jgi:hypothetical protein
VGRVDAPDALELADLAPVQLAAGAVEGAEDLGHVAGVHHQQPHAVPHALPHALHDGVVHPVVRGVSPPEQDVGLGEHVLREPVLRLFQRGGADRQVGRRQLVGQRAVQPLRIELGHRRLLPLMDVLVPDGDADRCGRVAHGGLLWNGRMEGWNTGMME